MKHIGIAYVYDQALHQALNRKKRNYWDIYFREMNEQLGLRAGRVSLRDLEQPRTLERLATLMIGWQSGAALNARAKRNLKDWVRNGGLLIGFGLRGLDDVFGIKTAGQIKQKPDDYTIAGLFDLKPHALTTDIHSPVCPDQELLIFSDIRRIQPGSGAILSQLYDPFHNPTDYAAVVTNTFGAGQTLYFAFDAAKTIWLLHQGKPVWQYPETQQYARTMHMCLLGDNARRVLYADEILFLMQNFLAQRPHAFIYPIPPQGGKVPDALLYWGGDEYRGPVEHSLKASDWMKSKGLPYHINLEVDHHPITLEQARHIMKDNGHELSEYYYIPGAWAEGKKNYHMSAAMFKRQNDLFYKKFGFRPITSVNFSLHWRGWVEPARWMAQAGGKADNSFASNAISVKELVLRNSAGFQFGFGTCYPYYFYEDYPRGNRKINLLEEPIVCYEIGHRGSIRDMASRPIQEVHVPLDFAVKYHLVMNMFYHPGYIADYPICREAIEEILRYIGEKKARVVHMGNDAVWKWWDARSRSAIDNVRQENNTITLTATCKYDGGMIVKWPAPGIPVEVRCDGQTIAVEERKEFGRPWLHIAVPFGRHALQIVPSR